MNGCVFQELGRFLVLAGILSNFAVVRRLCHTWAWLIFIEDMKKGLAKLLAVFATLAAVMALWKVVFMAVRMPDQLGALGQVMLHGLPMDMSVAGYLSVIPGLLIAAATLTRLRWPRVALDVYFGLVSALLGGIYCLDLLLYGYWGFRLDMTPVFYFTTSPSAAMASARWWEVLAGLAAWGAAALLTWLALTRGAGKIDIVPSVRRRWAPPAAVLVATALLFIPIRGSFTVSTMNLSRSYFSRDIRLNHAATNPAFSLLYSATHQSDFGSQFRYFEPAEADRLMASLLAPAAVPDSAAADAPCPGLLRAARPDVVLVILESFSSHLLPSLGGDSVAVGLDSLGREGLLFSDIYASSFRTDRGVPAILSAFPGPPTVSVMKYVDKIERLPSFPRVMRDKGGYRLAYYYGGDANFFNMMAYLMCMGFDRVVSDRDFPVKEKMSKWGAHDDVLFSRAWNDIKAGLMPLDGREPTLTVVQTSSSHEPFEVPYDNPRFVGKPRRNAFAFTDSCLTAFVDSLRTLPSWGSTLVIAVPDHYGAWPRDFDDVTDRHRIPVVMAGGALRCPGTVIDKTGGQTDIAATLLAALGLPAGEFRYSRDLLDPRTPPAAVFSQKDRLCVVTPSDTVVFNLESGEPERLSGPAAASRLDQAKAFLQRLYLDLDSL